MHTNTRSSYIFLGFMAAIYLALVLRFQTVPKYILLATAGFALVYVLWGIIHEHSRHHLHLGVVLEYLLVAILGVAIVSTLLL